MKKKVNLVDHRIQLMEMEWHKSIEVSPTCGLSQGDKGMAKSEPTKTGAPVAWGCLGHH
jgi:hypothetical protein